jgi:polypeptide N-acetylgalactosaminyltransferase
MAGGLFAIDRKYFWEIGSYDSDMQLWGGENLEMSFRVWTCGGSVEIIPCSRVGHIFRSFHPYTFPGNVDSHGLNTARLAEVWMDEYKEYFFHHRPELKNANYGDVTKRLEFKKRANCKGFEWYLDNVFKEKFRLDRSSTHMGQVKNKKTNQCLDNMQHSDNADYVLDVYPCHPQTYPSQTFFLSNTGQLRREVECGVNRGGKNRVEMVPCEDNPSAQDKWEYKDSILRHIKSNKCLSVVMNSGKGDLTLEPCVEGASSQLWSFVNKPEV